VLLAQSGCGVPARAGARVPVFSAYCYLKLGTPRCCTLSKHARTSFTGCYLFSGGQRVVSYVARERLNACHAGLQGLATSLSTLSCHLRRISAARLESDLRSLVLVDELDMGTDPVEGSAIAAALLWCVVRGRLDKHAQRHTVVLETRTVHHRSGSCELCLPSLYALGCHLSAFSR
jgi:hypothetical protein